MRTDVEFKSAGVTVRGYLERPEPKEPAPVVVMAHGFGGLKEWLEPQSAAFAKAGIAALEFDYGTSGPVMAFPASTSIRWHRSGHTGTRSRLPRQGPSCNILMTTGRPGSRAPTIRRWRSRGTGPGVALPDPATTAFFAEQAAKTPTWRDEITVASYDLLLEFAPQAFISAISPRPLLMTAAGQDTRNPADLAISAYEGAREPNGLHIIPGGHHAPYHDQFQPVMDRQIEFLARYL